MSSFDELRFNQAFEETIKKFSLIKKVDSGLLLKQIILLINSRLGKVEVQYGKIFDEVLNQYPNLRNYPDLKKGYKSLFGLYFSSFRKVNPKKKSPPNKTVAKTPQRSCLQTQLKLFS